MHDENTVFDLYSATEWCNGVVQKESEAFSDSPQVHNSLAILSCPDWK